MALPPSTDSPPTPMLTPAEMADRTGVSLDTLRYYESEGLLADVARAANGHRRYSQDDVLWIEVLRCLRETGMTIEQLRHYCRLGERGPATKPERKRILLEHRALVERQIAERRHALELIDHKLVHYAETDIDIGVGVGVGAVATTERSALPAHEPQTGRPT
ncbi:MAG: MerR family transcriptional regulator [Actinomycetota bacterium]